MSKYKMKFKLFLLLLFMLSYDGLFAQKDTAVKPSVTIISSYKPVLISPAKINIYGSPLPSDTNREVRAYNIPSQSYIYSYDSAPLNPLTMQTDSNELLKNLRHFVKVGYGNLQTPMIQAGAFVNSIPSTVISANLSSISSKGKIKNQDYSQFSFKSTATYLLKGNEAHANISFDRNQYYLFGYDHTQYDFSKKDISHLFNDVSLLLGIKNLSSNLAGLNYHPTIGFGSFSTKDSLTERTFHLSLPIEVRLNDQLSMAVKASLDATSVSLNNQIGVKEKFKNNISSISGMVKFKNDLFNISAGANAVMSFSHWSVLPDIKAEMPLASQNIYLFAGWTSDFNKNTYRNLSVINPYLKVQSLGMNTFKNEIYGGVKSFIGKFISVSAKAGWERYRNFQVFLHDTSANARLNSFILSNEAHLNNFTLHGELSYVKHAKLSFLGEVTFNGYTGMKTNEKAWNTIPMEARINFISQINKKIKLTGIFYLFAGGHYLEKGNVSKIYEGGSDLSIASEYKISKMFIGFLNLNNIFGKSYERWRYYPVYGFNALGGVKVSF